MAIRETPGFVLEVHEHYQRQTYRNRYQIIGPNGLQTLSIPVRHNHGSKIPVRDVEIDYRENWQQNHWRSIVTAYRNSPYFIYLEDAFRPFFEQKTDTLFDWNFRVIESFFRLMKWKKEILFSDAFLPLNLTETDYRDRIHPKRPAVFPVREYQQVFQERHGFIPDVSMLDLLFCAGLSEL